MIVAKYIENNGNANVNESTLNGGAGDDTLIAGNGSVLIGGEGGDTFIVPLDGSDPNEAGLAAVIEDFEPERDKIIFDLSYSDLEASGFDRLGDPVIAQGGTEDAPWVDVAFLPLGENGVLQTNRFIRILGISELDPSSIEFTDAAGVLEDTEQTYGRGFTPPSAFFAPAGNLLGFAPDDTDRVIDLDAGTVGAEGVFTLGLTDNVDGQGVFDDVVATTAGEVLDIRDTPGVVVDGAGLAASVTLSTDGSVASGADAYIVEVDLQKAVGLGPSTINVTLPDTIEGIAPLTLQIPNGAEVVTSAIEQSGNGSVISGADIFVDKRLVLQVIYDAPLDTGNGFAGAEGQQLNYIPYISIGPVVDLAGNAVEQNTFTVTAI